MKRRDLLKTTGAAGVAGLVDRLYGKIRYDVGDERKISQINSTNRTNTTNPRANEFGTIIDAVEQGADPTGEEPINFLFEQNATDDTLLLFRPGEYKLDFLSLYGVSQFGVVGNGEDPATFVPADGVCRGGHPWMEFDQVTDLLVDNIMFDFRNVSRGGPVHFLLQGDSTVRDVTYLGSCSNQFGIFKIGVYDEDGTAKFERVESKNVDDNKTLTGMYVVSEHAGEVTFRDCNLERFSDNGLYASAPGTEGGSDGEVYVDGGTYKNNNIANIRLGSTTSRAENATVIVDSKMPGWDDLNSRGIRLRAKSGQIIDNCEIRFGTDAPDSFGGIVFHPQNNGALVRDTTITINRDRVPAIRAFPVAEAGTSAPAFRNLLIDGHAAEGVTAHIKGRDNTLFENCTIDQTGDDRQGLQFVNCTNCRITNSQLNVAKNPVVVTNGTVIIENSTVIHPDGEIQIGYRRLENETLTIDGTSEGDVGPGDLTGDGAPATDPDGDGIYEDINGDGRISTSDVTALFDLVVNNHPATNSNQLDINGNGDGATAADVATLFNIVLNN